jgi:hypothetical protein
VKTVEECRFKVYYLRRSVDLQGQKFPSTSSQSLQYGCPDGLFTQAWRVLERIDRIDVPVGLRAMGTSEDSVFSYDNDRPEINTSGWVGIPYVPSSSFLSKNRSIAKLRVRMTLNQVEPLI